MVGEIAGQQSEKELHSSAAGGRRGEGGTRVEYRARCGGARAAPAAAAAWQQRACHERAPRVWARAHAAARTPHTFCTAATTCSGCTMVAASSSYA